MKDLIAPTILAGGAALAYFAGYCYLYFYYGYFGIDISELSLDANTFFVHSYISYSIFISSNKSIFLITASISAYFIYNSKYIFRFDPYIKSIVLLYFILIVSSYPISRYSGNAKAGLDIESLKLESIILKDGYRIPEKYEADLDWLRHVASSKDTVFAIQFSKDGSNFFVYRIPKNNVIATRVYMD